MHHDNPRNWDAWIRSMHVCQAILTSLKTHQTDKLTQQTPSPMKEYLPTPQQTPSMTPSPILMKIDKVNVMTVRLGLLFFFPIPFPPSPYYGHPSFVPWCLVNGAPSFLSITCLTLAFTVLHTRASVPADVRPLCTVHACISSPLPYVSLHLLCTPPDPPNMCSTTPLVRVLVV